MPVLCSRGITVIKQIRIEGKEGVRIEISKNTILLFRYALK